MVGQLRSLYGELVAESMCWLGGWVEGEINNNAELSSISSEIANWSAELGNK